MIFAIAGNPNCGKTTIFNKLTGSNQRVGNWAGVTVEQKRGSYTFKGSKIDLVDLPGIYSLSSNDDTSLDAVVACQFILTEKPDAVINVIDASNIERNLFLTVQLIEMKVPLIVVLNMVDVAENKGNLLDAEKLENLLGVKVISTIGRKGIGLKGLSEELIKKEAPHTSKLDFSGKYGERVLDLAEHLKSLDNAFIKNPEWLALRLLEGDVYAKSLLKEIGLSSKGLQLEIVSKRSDLISVSVSRYKIIADIIEKCSGTTETKKHKLTEFIDSICLNKYLGIPIFLIIMYVMFEFAITIGGALQPFFDNSSRAILIDWVNHAGPGFGLPVWGTAIFSQGVGLGINTVLTFLPQIACMFLFLSMLEDSGYMARAAFVMDRFMKSIGLPGKAFVPLIVGFGCNVPAVMATRTLDTRRDRILTAIMSPFICCGARLAIFAIFAGAFFPSGGATVVFLLYIIGIICAVITGLIIKNTLLRGNNAPFLMEIPVYHMPNIRSILQQTWDRSKRFIFKAGVIIIPACILIGALNVIQVNGQVNIEGSKTSMLSVAGKAITPVLYPMGVKDDNWPATVGLITGTMAKEVVLGTLNTLYTQREQADNGEGGKFSLEAELSSAVTDTVASFKNMSLSTFINPFTANKSDASMDNGPIGSMVVAFGSTAAAFAYMLFVLLYVPCIATIGATAREIGKGWAWFSVFWSFLLAYAVAVIAYQISLIPNYPLDSTLWITGMLILIGVTVFFMKNSANKNKTIPAGGAVHPI